jgi:hypothetical protein
MSASLVYAMTAGAGHPSKPMQPTTEGTESEENESAKPLSHSEEVPLPAKKPINRISKPLPLPSKTDVIKEMEDEDDNDDADNDADIKGKIDNYF